MSGRKVWRRYTFSPELVEELRLAYVGTRGEITANLNRLQKRTGYPRYILRNEAAARGFNDPHSWSEADVTYLLENAGSMPVAELSERLHRTRRIVVAKLNRLQDAQKRGEKGYRISDIAALFGVWESKARRWVERGLFGKHYRGADDEDEDGADEGCQDGGEHRVAERDVVRFIEKHFSEYDLGRVNQAWFKAVVFGPPAIDGDAA